MGKIALGNHHSRVLRGFEIQPPGCGKPVVPSPGGGGWGDSCLTTCGGGVGGEERGLLPPEEICFTVLTFLQLNLLAVAALHQIILSRKIPSVSVVAVVTEWPQTLWSEQLLALKLRGTGTGGGAPPAEWGPEPVVPTSPGSECAATAHLCSQPAPAGGASDAEAGAEAHAGAGENGSTQRDTELPVRCRCLAYCVI